MAVVLRSYGLCYHNKKQLFPNEERAVFVVVKNTVSLIVLVNAPRNDSDRGESMVESLLLQL